MFGKSNFFRQLKLNKVDFNKVLNALESAQLSLNSLQLVACFGILDLGRWTSTNLLQRHISGIVFFSRQCTF